MGSYGCEIGCADIDIDRYEQSLLLNILGSIPQHTADIESTRTTSGSKDLSSFYRSASSPRDPGLFLI